jgi:hypothetical protein
MSRGERKRRGGKEAVTFLKKSNQKTFAELDRADFTATGPDYQKFFASFF